MRKRRVCLDACVFMALTAAKQYPAEVLGNIRALLDGIEKGDVVGVASALIVTELLDGSLEVLEKAFDNRKGFFVDVDPPIASLARTVRNKILRHEKKLETPDCIYIATAVIHKCDALVTLDGLSDKAGQLSVSGKHRLLSAASEINKEFGLTVCTPMAVVNQPALNLEGERSEPNNA